VTTARDINEDSDFVPGVRLATAADRAALHRLFHETDLHYWGAAAPSFEAMAHHVDNRILAPGSGCEVVLAEIDGRPAGYATFAIVYPAPNLTGQIFMKDIFISEPWRSHGVGEAMLRFLARLALERGCSRLDWTAERDNPRALAFYERLGARRVDEKVYYRVDGDDLQAMARLRR
jgi:GNAT superfamily N-acetyltransferase